MSTHPEDRRHTTVVETGTIAGILFMVFGLFGFFSGVFIFGLAQWELAKEIGRTQAIGIINQSHLEACSTMLISDRDLNEIQRSYCADTIDAALGVVEWRTDK